MILFEFIGLIVLCWEFLHPYSKRWLPSWLSGEEPTSHTGDAGSILWYGRSPGGGNGNPFPYSCLEHSVEKRAWWAAVQGVTNCWRWLSVHVHKRWWSMVFFFLWCLCLVLVSEWWQPHKVNLGVLPPLQFLEEFEKDKYKFFFVCLELPSEAIQTFVCRKFFCFLFFVFNYR